MSEFVHVSYNDDELRSMSKGIISDISDINIRGNHPVAVANGLFDKTIFGSEKYCNCGNSFPKGGYCPTCNTHIMDESELMLRFGHIEFEYPYLNPFNAEEFISLISSVGFRLPYNGKMSINAKSFPKLLAYIYSCMFRIKEANEYDDTTFTSNGRKVVVDIQFAEEVDNIDFDSNYYGLIGLKSVLNNIESEDSEINNKLVELNSMLHYVLMVPPAITRMYSIMMINGKLRIQVPEINNYYRSMIFINNNIHNLINAQSNLTDKLALLIGLNMIICGAFNNNPILQTSKQSFVRTNVKSFALRSGRATITGRADIDIDHVVLPRALVYHSIQDVVIQELSKYADVENPLREYTNCTNIANSVFMKIVEQSCALLVRNPTLHKYNLTAFKIIISDDLTIGIPIAVCSSFNADFDGDQMAYFIVTDPEEAKENLEKLGTQARWFYEKDQSPVYAPNREVLQGIAEATKIAGVDSDAELQHFDSFEDAESAFESMDLSPSTQIIIGTPDGDLKTTYGRYKFYKLTGIDLTTIIGDDSFISAKNISKVVSAIYSLDNKSQILMELQQLGIKTLRKIGVTTLTLADLYTAPDKYKETFDAILNSNASEEEKHQRLNSTLQFLMKPMIDDLPKSNIRQLIEESNRLKLSQIADLISPSITTGADGHVTVDYSNHINGKNTKAYLEECIRNRVILSYKQMTVPIGGYNARQLATLGMSLTYTDKDRDYQGAQGIIIPEDKAEGRVVLNHPREGYVEVLSCINNDENLVYKNELTDGKYYLADESIIGTSFMTSLSESFTQSSLGLKHGGSEYHYSDESVKADEHLMLVSYDSDFIVMSNDRGVEKKYKLPNKYFRSEEFLSTNEVAAGDAIFYQGNPEHITESLSRISTFIDTDVADKRVEKKKLTQCYAPCDGVIHYSGNKVFIGDHTLQLDNNQLYFFYDGQEVKFMDRICTGILNVYSIPEEYRFAAFYKQLTEITRPSLNIEVAEVLYKLIVNNGFSVRDTNRIKENLLDSLYKGDTKKTFRLFTQGKLPFSTDNSLIQHILFKKGIIDTETLLNSYGRNTNK